MKDLSFIYFYFILGLILQPPFFGGEGGGGDCSLVSMLLGIWSSQNNRKMIVSAHIFPDNSVNEPFVVHFASDP